jgi:hypothetical protein
MNRICLLAAGGALALSLTGAGSFAADYYESDKHVVYDYPYCLELARQEGNVIIELAALHPLRKHHDEVIKARVEELNADRRAIHRQREYVKCI